MINEFALDCSVTNDTFNLTAVQLDAIEDDPELRAAIRQCYVAPADVKAICEAGLAVIALRQELIRKLFERHWFQIRTRNAHALQPTRKIYCLPLAIIHGLGSVTRLETALLISLRLWQIFKGVNTGASTEGY